MAKKTKGDVVIDFKGADPVSGGRRYDRIPEGTYELVVKTAIVTQTTSDKPAVAVAWRVAKGEYKGKTVGDMFVLPRKNADDSIFPVQRLHGLLVAAKVTKRMKKASTAAKVCVMLAKRHVIAEVADSTIPASGNYSERVTSAPQSYFAVGSKAAKEAIAAASAVDDEDEDEDIDEEEEDEAPKKRGKKAKKEEEDEDVYDEDEDEDEEDEEDGDDEDEDDDDEDDYDEDEDEEEDE